MAQHENEYYKAYQARDVRFDGIFFIGVITTGIYCRPVCPAKTPRESNCRFFTNAAQAEAMHFRPCLRCRPELAPGLAPVDDAARLAGLIAQRICDNTADANGGLEELAAEFGFSARHIRRIVQKEFGVPPIALIQTQRLLLAKQLLTDTSLPMTEVAYASGFSSLRRFNSAFRGSYGMAPSRLRKSSPQQPNQRNGTSTVYLSYRPPYDWDGILAFLKQRALTGIEWIEESSYARTASINGVDGWFRVRHLPEKNALALEFSHSLLSQLPELIRRVRRLFDLDARPDVIASHLGRDSVLKKSVRQNPGLRVPGAFDGFEMAVRAILGQQVTVKAATTLACRYTTAFGIQTKTPFEQLSHLSPVPEKIARLKTADIAKLGIVSARANCMIAMAKSFAAGDIRLEAGMIPDKVIDQLTALPGIGPWTAHYIAMRGLRWPDAFPKEDIAIRNNLGGISAKEAEALSQKWRPWRSYAVLHIWRSLTPRKQS